MRWFVSLLVAGAVIGCSSLKASEQMSSTNIAVTIEIDPPTIPAGASAKVTVIVANTGPTAQTLEFRSGCLTRFEFLDAAGKVVGSSVEMCTQVLTQRTLAPGGSFRDEHPWGRSRFDFPQLAAGRYQIRGVLLATGDSVLSKPLALVLP